MKHIWEFIKKHLILTIIVTILIILFIVIWILFIKKPEIFNYKKITYKRNEVCNQKETVTEEAKNIILYQLLNTTKYSDKILVLNNFNVVNISFKSYKNKPAKLGQAQITLKNCETNKTETFSGRYDLINEYVVFYLENEVYVYHFDKKKNILEDINSYLREKNIFIFNLEK